MHAQYKMLEKFEVTISYEEQSQLESLQSTWASLKQTIAETEQMIKNKKVRISPFISKNTNN